MVATIKDMQRCRQEEIADLDELLADPDSRCRDERNGDLGKRRAGASGSSNLIVICKSSYCPKIRADEKNAILEVRAGTGGDEAALFAGSLYRMYQRYADLQGWKMQIISANESAHGGFKEVIASISGKGVFARMKYESGVHRVQRVPETESGGRIHTSAATVAVLPEAEEVDVQLEESDSAY